MKHRRLNAITRHAEQQDKLIAAAQRIARQVNEAMKDGQEETGRNKRHRKLLKIIEEITAQHRKQKGKP